MPLPRRRLLDPRSLSLAASSPILDAVNIPFEELRLRSHELPPPGEIVWIAAEQELGASVGGWLTAGGREWELLPPTPGVDGSPGRMWRPHPMIEAVCEARKPGVAWDLGCGSGRDAVYLASAGWQVVAIDHLPDALDRGRLSAERLLGGDSDRVRWEGRDIGGGLPAGQADLISMLFFFDRPSLLAAIDALVPGGVLLLEAFTPTNRALTGRPRNPALTIDGAEARQMLRGFDIRICEEAQREGKHTLTVWAEKAVDLVV